MVWHRLGNKPLSKPMLTRFTDAYMRHWGGGGGVNDPLAWTKKNLNFNPMEPILD